MQAIDVLQAASNAVAGNVTGPVDILSLLLRKIGVPVPENALGSSQWAREHGLLRDVDDPYARAAGESLGIIAPMVAAAKAPQIARGLLKAGDNLAAPRTLNPQTGAIVWHGSPHKFDKFDSSKIGTGEGAQAYGHGLYLAESPEVAQTYLGTGRAKGGAQAEARLARAMEKASDAGRYGEALAIEELLINRSPAKAVARFSDSGGGQQYKDALEALKKYASLFEEGGLLYKVDLPDTAIARMLDWDKPLSQQTESVRLLARPPSYTNAFKAGAHFRKSGKTYDKMSFHELERLVNYTPAEQAFFDAGRLGLSPPKLTIGNRYGDAPKHGRSMNYADDLLERGVSMATVKDVRFDDSWDKTISSLFIKPGRENKTYQGYVLPPQMPGSDGEPLMVALRSPETGKEYWDRLVKTLGGQDAAAKSLSSRGIPGIRYLDGGSRGAGTGTSNFVVFPGEEALLTILERNGIPLP